MLFEKIELEPGETILKMVRKHWLIIMLELLMMGLVALLPVGLLFGMAFTPLSGLVDWSAYSTLMVFVICFWWLLSIMSAFAIWTNYYLDLWVVTDRRIILVDQINFFNRNVSIFRLERMQDIEYKITGIIPTLLNYGTLKAQTAGGHESNFSSPHLPDPRGLQATIQKAMDERLRVLHIHPDQPPTQGTDQSAQ